MPKELTHWILAERAMAGLAANSRIGEIIRSNHEIYLAGAVLPDTLLHLLRGPDSTASLALARSFHDAGDNSYAPLIRVEQEFPDGAPAWLMACLLGVISHMQGDITFHPFVFGTAGSNDMGSHYRLETAVDVYLLRRGAILPTRHLRDLVTPRIKEELITAASLLFDPQGALHPGTIGKALELHCRFQGRYDQIFWKLLARIVGRLPGSHLIRIQHLFYPLDMSQDNPMTMKPKPWIHPVTGERQTTTIDELADQAVLQTIKIFEDIELHGSLATALTGKPGENLLTGVHGVRRQDMKNSSNSGTECGRHQEKTS